MGADFARERGGGAGDMDGLVSNPLTCALLLTCAREHRSAELAVAQKQGRRRRRRAAAAANAAHVVSYRGPTSPPTRSVNTPLVSSQSSSASSP